MAQNHISEDEMPEFKKLYNKAKKENKEIFLFKEQEVYVGYAKYVIEYFDSLKKK